MERMIEKELLRWKNRPDRKPLILQGARQVGKTWIMKQFGERYFSSVAYISLDSNDRMKRVFDGDFDIDRILAALNAESGVAIRPQETLLILDEVQEVPRALSSLKYFCENAREYAVIVAGSLLGVAIHSGVSFPVGKVQLMTLYPLTFSEFLTALGKREHAEMLDRRDYGMMEIFRDQFVDYLKRYYYIGGMPEAVENYRNQMDYGAVREIQTTILSLYETDFGKHIEGNELERLRMLWDSVPLQLAKENKKFFFGQIKKGARSAEYEVAVQWLVDCGLLHKVNRVSKPGMPLKSYQEQNVFKLYLNDVGLLGAMSDLPARALLEGSDVFTEFKGALTEQYVFQQLLAETPYTPFYFSPNEHTEIDFLVQREGEIVPIEVKASENLQSRSLKAYYEKYHPQECVRVSMANYREQEWMRNVPLWAVKGV